MFFKEAKTLAPSLSAENIKKGVLLDASGVFYIDNKRGFYKGALETFSALRKKGIKIGIITNTTALSDSMVKKFSEFGLHKGEHYDFLFTAGQVFRDALVESRQLLFKTGQKKKYFMFGKPHPVHGNSRKVLFNGTDYLETKNLGEADFIFIEVPHIDGRDIKETEPFEKNIRQLMEDMKKLGITSPLPMVCANPDRFVQEGNPPQVFVRQGYIAEYYESVGGKAFRYGKPGEFIFEKAFQEFRQYGITNKEDIVMVGDSPNTDIRGANLEHFPSILITGTGIASEESAGKEVSQYLKSLPLTDHPTYYVDSFFAVGTLIKKANPHLFAELTSTSSLGCYV